MSVSRSSLSPVVIRNNIHVKMNMPSMDLFDAIPALNHWFTLRHHRHDKTNHKGKQQEWFVGVFNEAAKADMEIEDNEFSGQKTEVHC